MWSNKAATTGLIAAFFIAAPAIARPMACPARLDGYALVDGQVLDGAPQDNAVLEGDALPARGSEQRTQWRVAYVYRRGRIVNLECDYAGGAKIHVAVRDPVASCLFTQRGRAVALGCRR